MLGISRKKMRWYILEWACKGEYGEIPGHSKNVKCNLTAQSVWTNL